MDGSETFLELARSRPAQRMAWRGAGPATTGERTLPEEAPVAFAYQGTSYAVMMATPADLEDFAIGFSLTEGLIARATDVEFVEILPQESGIVLRIALASCRAELFWQRRRYLAGPSGCGLCGIEALAQAARAAPKVTSDLVLSCGAVGAALASLTDLQSLNRETRAVHAAAFWHPRLGVTLLREDVGRHNALDKLAGAMARHGIDGRKGAILLSSRVSVEMVQKAAAIGVPVVVAVSAPTGLAVRLAHNAGMTLAAIARADGFEIFTHPYRFQ
jgi:FdhD protein